MQQDTVVPSRSNTRFTTQNARLMAQRSAEARRKRKLSLVPITAETINERGPEAEIDNETADATVVNAGKIVRQRIANSMLRLTEILESEPPETFKDVKGLIQTIKGLVESSSNLFNWNEPPKPRPLLQIGMVERLDVKADSHMLPEPRS